MLSWVSSAGADGGVNQLAAHAGVCVDDVHAGQGGEAGEGKLTRAGVPAHGWGIKV